VARARQPRHTIIAGEAELAAGVRALARACPHMRAIAARVGQPPLRRYAADLAGLARIVVGQQLSIASAAAIWSRTAALVQPFEPRRLLAIDDAGFKAAGLSAAKIRTLRALARAVASGELDIATLAAAPDDTVRERLTAVHGIGPWTADIFVMFCLGRADAWASGDLALQLQVKDVLGLEVRPGPRELDFHAERWRPWRGVAARLLWADYGLRKARVPMQPV
jgi:DNA-3-methyladenine glycosylase II